jgi:hypothetical protein
VGKRIGSRPGPDAGAIDDDDVLDTGTVGVDERFADAAGFREARYDEDVDGGQRSS